MPIAYWHMTEQSHYYGLADFPTGVRIALGLAFLFLFILCAVSKD